MLRPSPRPALRGHHETPAGRQGTPSPCGALPDYRPSRVKAPSSAGVSLTPEPSRRVAWGLEVPRPGCRPSQVPRARHCHGGPPRPPLGRFEEPGLISGGSDLQRLPQAGSVARTPSLPPLQAGGRARGLTSSDVTGSPRPGHFLHHTLPFGHAANARRRPPREHTICFDSRRPLELSLWDSLGSAVQSNR